MKKRQVVILSLILFFAVLIAFRLISNFQANSNKQKEKKVNHQYAKVIEVENAIHSISIAAYGRVNPSLSINISPEVSGVVIKGNTVLRQGVKFSKGALLFKIDDREAQLSLKARKSSFLNLMANALADVKIDYPDSYDKLYAFYLSLDVEKDFPELPNVSTTQEKAFLASRNVLSEYYNIQKDQIRLSKYTIRAPFSGYFADVFIQEGSFVSMGAPIAQLVKTSELEIGVPIDRENLFIVQPGQKVTMTTRGSENEWEGTVKRIEQQINVNTQSVNVYIVPSNDIDLLYPGMYVEVIIHAGEINDSFELPRKALGNDNLVQTIQDSIMSSRQIEVIKKNSNSYIVRGLKNNDMVITEQIPNLQEGQHIIPVK